MLNSILKLFDVNDIHKYFDIVLINEQIFIEKNELLTFFLIFNLFRQFIKNFDNDVFKNREFYSLFFHFNRRIVKIVEHDKINKRLKNKWKNVKKKMKKVFENKRKKIIVVSIVRRKFFIWFRHFQS